MEKMPQQKVHANLDQHALDASETEGQSMSPPAFQLKASSFAGSGDQPDANAATPPGQLLEESETSEETGAVMQKMENAFGADFSTVQLHPNSSQATAADSLAFTQGENIHFAPGQFNPGSQQGQELLGHELGHVIQQRKGHVPVTTEHNGFAINNDPALEQEADQMGKQAATGQIIQAKSPALQRKAKADGPIQRQRITRDLLIQPGHPGRITVTPSYRLFGGRGNLIGQGNHEQFNSGNTSIDIPRGTAGVLQIFARVRVQEVGGEPAYSTTARQSYRYSFNDMGQLVLTLASHNFGMTPLTGRIQLRFEANASGNRATFGMPVWAAAPNVVTSHRHEGGTVRTEYHSGEENETTENNYEVTAGGRFQGSGRTQGSESGGASQDGAGGEVEVEEEATVGGYAGLGGQYRRRSSSGSRRRTGHDIEIIDRDTDTTTTSMEWRNTNVNPQITAYLNPVGPIPLPAMQILGSLPIYEHHWPTGRFAVPDREGVQSAVLRRLDPQALDDLGHGRAYLEVIGYADLQGSEARNLDLSDRRAHALRDALEGLGVSRDRQRFEVRVGSPQGDRPHAAQVARTEGQTQEGQTQEGQSQEGQTQEGQTLEERQQAEEQEANPEWRVASVYLRYRAQEASQGE